MQIFEEYSGQLDREPNSSEYDEAQLKKKMTRFEVNSN
jgi:hypothetical protein